jgi:hypothetical protein
MTSCMCRSAFADNAAFIRCSRSLFWSPIPVDQLLSKNFDNHVPGTKHAPDTSKPFISIRRLPSLPGGFCIVSPCRSTMVLNELIPFVAAIIC